MKLTRKQLRRIIAESINMPEYRRETSSGIGFPGKIRPSTIDPGDYSDDQESFLRGTHQDPASVQLTTDQMFDYSGAELTKHGVTQIDAYEARKQVNAMPMAEGPADEVDDLKSKISNAYLLIDPYDEADMELFMTHVQGRQPDASGRRVLVVMGRDDANGVVIFKDAFNNPQSTAREGQNYYTYDGYDVPEEQLTLQRAANRTRR